MWELDCKEIWVPKNWCFELWCWRRLFRVRWSARRSNQSILKEISPEYLATWCEELTHLKRPWCWERLKEEGEGDSIGWDGWMASLTWWTLSVSTLRELVMDREAWRAAVHRVTELEPTEWLNWMDTILIPDLSGKPWALPGRLLKVLKGLFWL